MERNEVIRVKLAELGEDFDALKPFMQTYLEKVETFIASKEKEQSEAIQSLRAASYNVSDVSKELNCSRTTLYNHNQLLKRYIELSIRHSSESNPLSQCEELRESKRELQERVSLMETRDIQIELDKHEVVILQRQIEEQQKEIERLQARVHELSAENHRLRTCDNTPAKVLKFKNELN